MNYLSRLKSKLTRNLQFVQQNGLRATTQLYLAKDPGGESTLGGRNLFNHFIERVKLENAGRTPKVLELGSRLVTGQRHRDSFDYEIDFTGFDIHPGPNVDVVGDSHELSRYFGTQKFDAVYSMAVFEHLAMPWKVSLELNKVMRPGAWLYTSTHPVWPPHELPWDFWRFTPGSFHALFNPATGYRVEEILQRGKCRIIPIEYKRETGEIAKEKSHLFIQALAQKVSEPRQDLDWKVSMADVTGTTYPKA